MGGGIVDSQTFMPAVLLFPCHNLTSRGDPWVMAAPTDPDGRDFAIYAGKDTWDVRDGPCCCHSPSIPKAC